MLRICGGSVTPSGLSRRCRRRHHLIARTGLRRPSTSTIPISHAGIESPPLTSHESLTSLLRLDSLDASTTVRQRCQHRQMQMISCAQTANPSPSGEISPPKSTTLLIGKLPFRVHSRPSFQFYNRNCCTALVCGAHVLNLNFVDKVIKQRVANFTLLCFIYPHLISPRCLPE
jgi:hypothetical protein